MATRALRSGSIRTDSQTTKTLKLQHRPQGNGTSPESTGAREQARATNPGERIGSATTRSHTPSVAPSFSLLIIFLAPPRMLLFT